MNKTYFGNVIEEPILQQIEETNEIYFSFKIKTLSGESLNLAISNEANNNYEDYKLGRPVKVDFEDKNNLRIAKNVDFITKQELIDKALEEHREGKITLDDYIRICKNNLQNIKTDKQEEQFERKVERNNILSFKNIEIIPELTEENIYKEIENFLKKYIKETDLNTDIIGIQLVGSRTKGLNQINSDLDCLVEYNNSDIREDDLFNGLNENPLIINGIQIDFNPINKERSYSLSECLELNYNYNKNQKSEPEDEEEDEL